VEKPETPKRLMIKNLKHKHFKQETRLPYPGERAVVCPCVTSTDESPKPGEVCRSDRDADASCAHSLKALSE
jgi:hypothetical protein